jgi:hypothetical protein
MRRRGVWSIVTCSLTGGKMYERDTEVEKRVRRRRESRKKRRRGEGNLRTESYLFGEPL